MQLFCVYVIVLASTLLFAKQERTLILLGDSQACGASIVARASKEIKNEFDNVETFCKVGSRTSYWNEVKLGRRTARDVVLVYLGSNDANLIEPSKVLGAVKETDAKCVWVGPPIPAKKKINEDLKKKIVEEGTCSYVDSIALQVKLGDGIHPASSSEHLKWLRAALKASFEQ